MWDTTALDLNILGPAIGITSTYSISQLTIAINQPVWHSHSVLKPRGNTMKHFIQSDAQVMQVMPVIRRGALRAKNGLWTPGASLRFA
jgi:hypothetical protein